MRLWLCVDGEVRQDGNTRDMIFSIPEQIAYVSRIMRLDPGDLLLTGTPPGVGRILPGQVLTAGLGDGLCDVRFSTVERRRADVH